MSLLNKSKHWGPLAGLKIHLSEGKAIFSLEFQSIGKPWILRYTYEWAPKQSLRANEARICGLCVILDLLWFLEETLLEKKAPCCECDTNFDVTNSQRIIRISWNLLNPLWNSLYHICIQEVSTVVVYSEQNSYKHGVYANGAESCWLLVKAHLLCLL